MFAVQGLSMVGMAIVKRWWRYDLHTCWTAVKQDPFRGKIRGRRRICHVESMGSAVMVFCMHVDVLITVGCIHSQCQSSHDDDDLVIQGYRWGYDPRLVDDLG